MSHVMLSSAESSDVDVATQDVSEKAKSLEILEKVVGAKALRARTHPKKTFK